MTTIVLDQKLDSRSAATLTTSLLDARGKDLTVDVSKTTMIGALALQTLMVAAATWERAGKAFVIDGASEDLRAQVALMGIDLATLKSVEAA